VETCKDILLVLLNRDVERWLLSLHETSVDTIVFGTWVRTMVDGG
jgi:hypothetical protein